MFAIEYLSPPNPNSFLSFLALHAGDKQNRGQESKLRAQRRLAAVLLGREGWASISQPWLSHCSHHNLMKFWDFKHSWTGLTDSSFNWKSNIYFWFSITTPNLQFLNHIQHWPERENDGERLPWFCYLVTNLCLILLQSCGPQPTRLLCPWDFPGMNTGVGCHFLVQGIFTTRELEPGSPASAGGVFTAEPAVWL